MEFEFERKAMKGEPCPKRLDIADTYAYISLKNLYKMYKAGLISREEAKKEKETIVYNWKTNKSQLEFLSRECEALKNKIKIAAEEYEKSPTLENAERLYCAIYNLPENWRSQEQYKTEEKHDE